MRISFDRLCLMVLLENPTDLVLFTCIGVGGWVYPSSLSVLWMGKLSLKLIKVAQISASVTEDITVDVPTRSGARGRAQLVWSPV